jgi:hypothetical protein
MVPPTRIERAARLRKHTGEALYFNSFEPIPAKGFNPWNIDA